MSYHRAIQYVGKGVEGATNNSAALCLYTMQISLTERVAFADVGQLLETHKRDLSTNGMRLAQQLCDYERGILHVDTFTAHNDTICYEAQHDYGGFTYISIY